jgi:ribosome biogenesis GTPase
VVGDRVSVSLSSEHRGVVEDVRPRRNLLSRVSEEDDSAFQIIAANLDRLVVVLAAEPFPPRWVLADRLLVLAEREGFEAALVVNKIDLAGAAARKSIATAAEAYARIGVPLVGTSALEGTGLERLRECLEGQLSLLCGHSGVGKSSLLNRLCPGVELATGAVNEQTGKGRHTTTVARLVKLPFGGYLVDTPGFREFGLGHVAPAELGRFYPEFRPVIGHCRFSNCLHRDEPGCALKRAVDRAEVSNFRYQNYLQILAGLVEKGL